MQPRMTCRQTAVALLDVRRHMCTICMLPYSGRQVCPWLHLALCLSCVALTWLDVVLPLLSSPRETTATNARRARGCPSALLSVGREEPGGAVPLPPRLLRRNTEATKKHFSIANYSQVSCPFSPTNAIATSSFPQRSILIVASHRMRFPGDFLDRPSPSVLTCSTEALIEAEESNEGEAVECERPKGMKWYQVWKLGSSDMKGVTVPRTRASPRRRIWISVVVIFVAITVLWAYLYPPQDYTYPVRDWFPSEPTRELTDAETAARVVFRQILSTPPFISRNPKIAFMFLTPGKLPFEKLWELFFKGHEGRYTIYVHASREKPEHVSPIFVGRDIHSEKVGWGMITMVDAERRLLAKALEDIDNQHFVLLSDSCVPLHNFDYVYDFLMGSRHSFLDCFHDPGPHGVYRYSKNMLPEVRESEFRKGSQWFSMKRQHAMVVIADSLYYSKFRLYCRPGMEEGRNCYADEHYLQTLFHMMDPAGIANWSVTYVDWSEGKWHPRSFRAKDVTYERLKNMTSIDVSYHITSDEKKEILQRPCLWNGLKRPCYLFARKFYPEALDNLVNLFSNYTIF